MRVLAVLALLAGPAQAQDAPAVQATPAEMPPQVLPDNTIPAPDRVSDGAPILTLDQDALYLSSAWGGRAQAQLDAEGTKITAENERLTELLSTEEARLTQQRAELAAAEFRRLAEDFDTRATTIRRERAQAVQRLNEWADADRAAFFRAALPVMGQLMQDRGAVAVLDRRTVFVSLDAIDVTGQLVTLLDQRIGDGDGVIALPPASGQAGDPVPDQVE